MRSWLRKSREQNGLTMKQMGEKLNISESYYCTIESGRRQKRMDLALVSEISAALGIPIAEIARLEAMPEPDTERVRR